MGLLIGKFCLSTTQLWPFIDVKNWVWSMYLQQLYLGIL